MAGITFFCSLDTHPHLHTTGKFFQIIISHGGKSLQIYSVKMLANFVCVYNATNFANQTSSNALQYGDSFRNQTGNLLVV
jgi:hypothetical protein